MVYLKFKFNRTVSFYLAALLRKVFGGEGPGKTLRIRKQESMLWWVNIIVQGQRHQHHFYATYLGWDLHRLSKNAQGQGAGQRVVCQTILVLVLKEDQKITQKRKMVSWGRTPGVSYLWPMGHMRPRMAVNVAQHKIVNLLKTFWVFLCVWLHVAMSLLCGPRQLVFFLCGLETPKVWTPLQCVQQHRQVKRLQYLLPWSLSGPTQRGLLPLCALSALCWSLGHLALVLAAWRNSDVHPISCSSRFQDGPLTHLMS